MFKHNYCAYDRFSELWGVDRVGRWGPALNATVVQGWWSISPAPVFFTFVLL